MSSVIKGKMPEHAVLLQDPAKGGIPFDVTFEIVDNQVKREIKAHKYILAASSSVFKSMFFGPMKESKNVIEVKETTFEAFEKMIEYIYHVDIECKNIDFYDLYDIVNLAESYDLPKLMEELKIQMENIPLSMDNLMKVASIASDFSHFQLSMAVLMSCAKFLQKTVRDPAAKLEFALKQHESGYAETAMELLALVKELPPLVECSNCKGNPCISGQSVPLRKMKEGLRMKLVNYYPTVVCHPRNTIVTVQGVNMGQVTVTGLGYNHKQVSHNYNSSWEYFALPQMTFIYSC